MSSPFKYAVFTYIYDVVHLLVTLIKDSNFIKNVYIYLDMHTARVKWAIWGEGETEHIPQHTHWEWVITDSFLSVCLAMSIPMLTSKIQLDWITWKCLEATLAATDIAQPVSGCVAF